MNFKVRLAQVLALLQAGDQQAMVWVIAKRWEQRDHAAHISTIPDGFATH
jgi:hypothetical protein